MQCVQIISVVLTIITAIRASERSVVVTKKSEKSDQATSGSEYSSFTMHSDGPPEYEAFKNANYNPSSENYGMPPVIPEVSSLDDTVAHPGYITYEQRYIPYDSGHFQNDHYPYDLEYHLPMDMMSKSYGSDVPISSYGLPISFSVNNYPYTLSQSSTGSAGSSYPRAAGYHGPSNYGDSFNYFKDFGKRYGETEKAIQGEKGESGYKQAQEFDKGAKSNYGNNGEKRFFEENGGKHSDHFDSAGHYAKKNQASKQNEEGRFSENKGHNKGSKTTGYHKVFYKDEYKKDHEFYDESDRKGEFEKFGNKKVQQSAQNRGFSKGASHDSGYKGQQAGVAGFSDKGQSVNEDSSYIKEAGKQAFDQNTANFAEKSGESESELKRFKDGSLFKDRLGF